MRWGFFFAMMVAGTVQAQEALPSAVPLQAEQLPIVSHTQPAPPPAAFSVDGVVVKLDESEGFNRDAALTAAARQGLPVALGQITPVMLSTKATEVAASIGEPMTFVKSYKIVKEILVPAYQLTVNLQFDGVKLQSNFGSKVLPEAVVSGTLGVTTTDTVSGSAEVSVAITVVHVESDTAQGQDTLFGKLAEAGLKPRWTLLRRDGGDIALTTALEGDALAEKLRALGFAPDMADDGMTLRP